LYVHRMIPSPFGEIAIVWDESPRLRVVRILIPSPRQTVRDALRPHGASTTGSNAAVDALCSELVRYLAGEPIEPSSKLLDPTTCTPFQWRVLTVAKAIPRGEVRTYAWLAAQVGCPRGARAAGNALARNPFPLILPCHRVVRGDGSLGGYHGGREMKRALLKMEGVSLDARGRATLPPARSRSLT